MKASELAASSFGRIAQQQPAPAQQKQSPVTFGETLKTFISDVNTLQVQAGKKVQDLSSGDSVEVHDVMVAAEKAKTSFELLMEVRNKTIDAYRELMRIPV